MTREILYEVSIGEFPLLDVVRWGGSKCVPARCYIHKYIHLILDLIDWSTWITSIWRLSYFYILDLQIILVLWSICVIHYTVQVLHSIIFITDPKTSSNFSIYRNGIRGNLQLWMERECPHTSLVVGECDPWPSHGKVPQSDGAVVATCDYLSKNQSHYKTIAPTTCTYQNELFW